jgi:hypothetical protein
MGIVFDLHLRIVNCVFVSYLDLGLARYPKTPMIDKGSEVR